jgi:hypothetical protein
MDAPYISALAALAGSAIGGFTSLAASWLSQHVQFKSQRLAHEVSRREALYESFIEEAAKLYADAYEHSDGEISKLVGLYALVGKMRLGASAKTIESADKVVRVIIETYRAGNKSFADVVEILDKQEMNPLAAFSDACRAELQAYVETR